MWPTSTRRTCRSRRASYGRRGSGRSCRSCCAGRACWSRYGRRRSGRSSNPCAGRSGWSRHGRRRSGRSSWSCSGTGSTSFKEKFPCVCPVSSYAGFITRRRRVPGDGDILSSRSSTNHVIVGVTSRRLPHTAPPDAGAISTVAFVNFDLGCAKNRGGCPRDSRDYHPKCLCRKFADNQRHGGRVEYPLGVPSDFVVPRGKSDRRSHRCGQHGIRNKCGIVDGILGGINRQGKRSVAT